MRSVLIAGLAVALCAVCGGAESAAALELKTSIDLDYSYAQENLGGDVNASAQLDQKYEINYETSLTTVFDFRGAVRVNLQDAWYTDAAGTSRLAPTLELEAKGSQLAAKIAYEAMVDSTDAYQESGEVTSHSNSLSFDLQAIPELWPEMKLRYQRRRDYQAAAKEMTADTFEFSMRKDIYGVRLEYNLKRENTDQALPARVNGTNTQWSGKAAYKEILWGGTEFELAYQIDEAYKDDYTRGVFSGDTRTFTQLFKTRLKNSLVIAPRMTLGLSWEYQYEQDLLELVFDYNLKNIYLLDLRWDAFTWLKVTGEARHETDLNAAVEGEEDERTLTDSVKAGFDLTSISWLQVSGKAEFRSEGKVVAGGGGSVDRTREEKYELVAKNKIGNFWDLTADATTSIRHTDDWLTNRETRVKTDLRLRLLDLEVTPSYEVSRTSDWEREFTYPVNQQQVRDARIKFEYNLQLLDMFKATFSHEYSLKIEDNLDEVLNFERVLQFSEGTRLTILLAEIVRDVRLEGQVERRASDTEGDTDLELVELSYSLKLDWKLDNLSVSSSIKFNDKGNTFDDVSFNARAGWTGERLQLSGEYQFDKIIKDITEPVDEKRKLGLKLSYKF